MRREDRRREVARPVLELLELGREGAVDAERRLVVAVRVEQLPQRRGQVGPGPPLGVGRIARGRRSRRPASGRAGPPARTGPPGWPSAPPLFLACSARSVAIFWRTSICFWSRSTCLRSRSTSWASFAGTLLRPQPFEFAGVALQFLKDRARSAGGSGRGAGRLGRPTPATRQPRQECDRRVAHEDDPAEPKGGEFIGRDGRIA